MLFFVLVSLTKMPSRKFKLTYTQENHFRGCLRTDLYVIHFKGCSNYLFISFQEGILNLHSVINYSQYELFTDSFPEDLGYWSKFPHSVHLL